LKTYFIFIIFFFVGEDPKSFQVKKISHITYYRSKDPMALGLLKYGGLPHWGKNRNLAFEGVFKK
jgi:hypothetical protein